MNDLKGKHLLILGGSGNACGIVKKAQEMGIYVIVTDWYPAEKSKAKQIADKAFMTSTTDIDALMKLIQDEKVDGILTGFTDSVLPYYAKICEEAGLPCYGTEEQFEFFINKRKYKSLCKQYGVPIIEEYVLNNSFREEDFKKIKYPVLVKPVDNSGARGITICSDKDELIAAYRKAIEFSQSKEVLIERYIDGKEVTVFWLFEDGNIYLTAMGNRHIKHNQEGVIALPVAYSYPSVYLEKYQDDIEPRVKDMLRAIGIKNGMMFMQCLVEDGCCIVYDIGYRLTGSLEYILLKEVCGYNPLEMMIRYAITGQMSDYSLREKVNPYWSRYACNVSFLVKPGRIGKIYGIDEILKIPNVIDTVLAHSEGEEILETDKGTLKQIILRVFATATNKKELEDVLNKIYYSLKVLSPDGENMLLDGFDTVELGGTLN